MGQRRSCSQNDEIAAACAAGSSSQGRCPESAKISTRAPGIRPAQSRTRSGPPKGSQSPDIHRVGALIRDRSSGARTPRPYNLGKRAASVGQTRSRIRAAALAEYAEVGIEEASMQSIARRADVAPGTVVYHYPDPDALAEEVVAASRDAMSVPTADAIDAGAPLAERIAWLTRELFRVYEGTDLEYHAWTRSQGHPVMHRYEQWYSEVYGQVLAAALGPAAVQPRALQVVSALIDPGFRGSLLQRGLSQEEAVDETVRLVLGWLAAGRTPAGPGDPTSGATS